MYIEIYAGKSFGKLATSLRQALQESPIGPFRPALLETGHVKLGFDYLGYRYTKTGSDINIQVSEKNIKKLEVLSNDGMAAITDQSLSADTRRMPRMLRQ